MPKLLMLLGVLIWCSCNNDASVNASKDTAQSSQTIHNNISDTVVTNKQPIVLNGCYQMTQKRDTATLRLTVKDSTVTGELNYDFYQKDRNTGTLNGVLRNNMIYADYTFQSEGTTTVREVVFKIQDSILLQGVGEITERNGKMAFQNSQQLRFQTANPFIKIACP